MAKVPRRGWGEGSITGGPDRWIIRVTIADGRRVKRTVRGTRKQARDALDDLRREVKEGLDPGSWTVGRYLETWQEARRRSDLSPATLDREAWMIRCELVPAVGNVPLRELNPLDIERRLLAPMAERGVSRGTMERVRGVLSMAYKHALKRKLVSWNPVSVTDIPRTSNPGRPSRAMTVEQLATFLRSIEDSADETLWRTMVGVGLRPGEVCGLRWQDLELDADPPLLHVRQARLGSKSGTPMFGPPKTAGSIRTLVLPASLVAALRRHRKAQAEHRLLVGSLWTDYDLVFPTETGRPIDRNNLWRRLYRATEGAGLGHWHPHELRHTFVTLCSYHGVPIEDIADTAGHSTTAITEQVYRHRQPVVGAAAATVMEGLLG
jgi:integrase